MNTVNTIEDITSLFLKELREHYPKGEIDAFAILTVSNLFGISKDEIRVRRHQPINPKEAERVYSITQELKTHKPIQYVLGKTDFYGCKLRVDEHVLIPRPETEELVDLILSDSKENTNLCINMLDIGTGSGCIAIAIKKNIANANVNAIDISEEALLIAKANAILNQTKISFLRADILAPALALPSSENEVERTKFDIIVSNPPYVRISEKEKMSKNILDYEPHLALFVNDNDPLLFYNAITEFALQNLAPNGKLYLEINEALGIEVKKLLEEKGIKNVVVIKDMNGKDRMIVSSKQSNV